MELVKTYLRVFQRSIDGLGRTQIDFGVNYGDMFLPLRIVVFSAADGTPTMYDAPLNYTAAEHINQLAKGLSFPDKLNVSLFGFDLRYWGVPGNYFLTPGTVDNTELNTAILEGRCFVLSYVFPQIRTMKYDGNCSILGIDMSIDTNQTNYVAPPYVAPPQPPNGGAFDDGQIIYPYLFKS